jgi:putative copper resistance protein D
MTSAVWTLLIILAKVGIFAGIIASAGGIAALRGYHNGSRASHARLLSYCLLGALLGFHSSLAPVLIQAGQINDAGLLGMFDIDLVLFLRGTPVWESAAYRGVGFALSALLVLALQKTLNAQRKSPEPVFYHIASFGQALALALVAYGFTLSGHISLLDPWVRAALTIHVAAMSIWLGMLLPLRWCCVDMQMDPLIKQMTRFSRLGIGLVATLVFTGITMLLSLIDVVDLFTTNYGRLMLLKLVAFTAVLLFAALNKWRYVPALSLPGGNHKLVCNIDREIFGAAALLIVAAVLTTALGPSSH